MSAWCHSTPCGSTCGRWRDTATIVCRLSCAASNASRFRPMNPEAPVRTILIAPLAHSHTPAQRMVVALQRLDGRVTNVGDGLDRFARAVEADALSRENLP